MSTVPATTPLRARTTDVVAVSVLMSVVAGAVHAAVIPSHLAESVWLAVGFLAAAVLQVAWSVVVARDGLTRPLAWQGAGLQVAIALGWVVSRTVGLPFGAHPWTPEPAGFLDVLTTYDEIVLAALLVLTVRLAPSRAVLAAQRAGLLIAALLVCLLVSGMGMVH